MTETNEEFAKELLENGNFFVVDFDNMYLLKVGKEKYFVRLHEEEIELKNPNGELVKGFKSTLHDAFDDSELFTRKNEISLASVVIHSTDGFDFFGKKAFLLKLITPSQKQGLEATAEYQRKYQELIDKYTSSGIDVSDGYYFKINHTAYIVRFEEKVIPSEQGDRYEYTFYDLLDNSVIATTIRFLKFELKDGTFFFGAGDDEKFRRRRALLWKLKND